jgi:hypothetical protein
VTIPALEYAARERNVTVIRTHYLDASALVKLFIDEDGSAAVRSYLEPQGNCMNANVVND